jgi:hypothetical protein
VRLTLSLLTGLIMLQAQASGSTAFTLGQLADSVWTADSLANFQAYDAKLHSRVVSAVWALRKFSQKSDAISFADELKATRPEALGEKAADMGKILMDVEFLKTVSINELKEALVAAQVPTDRILSLREPVTAFQRQEIKMAYDRSRNRLFRYEQRYGKHAPDLNLLEAGVAYALQGFYPFGPNESGPGSLEPVARYSTTWALAYMDKTVDLPREFTVAALWEIGLRWYWYSAPEARPSFLSLLKPEFIAAGYATAASKRDWFFFVNDEPFDPGFFVDIGVFKVAMTFGDNDRVFIGRQFQIFPHVF